MKTIFKRIFPILIVLAMILTAMPLQVFAATTVSILNGEITVTGTSTTSVSDNIVTASAKGGYVSQTTNTLTITNATDSTATVSFDYSASNYNSFSESAAKGTKSVILGAGESITMSITGKKAISSNTATLTLSNFVYKAASASANVTLNFDSACGSVTAEGAATSNGDVITVDDGALAVVATPASGYSFYAWVNADTREVLSSSVTYSVPVVKDITVEAVFSNNSASSKAYFYADKEKYLFDDLNKAGQFAATSVNKTIVLMASGTLSASDYTIPTGVTLLIPFDSANTLYTSTPKSVGYDGIPILSATAKQWSQPTKYRELIMASGANISVNGAISLSAKHSFCQGGKPSGGAPSGPCSYIYMNENSSITVNNGASLYAWGYIYGKGSVTAKSGANVYENFQIEDFRGGTQSTKMENGVFPTAQYYIQNIEVPLTIEAGAYENTYTSIFMSKSEVNSSVKLFSTSEAMFNLTSGSVTKWYDGTTDRLNITLNENSQMTVSPVSLKIGTSTIDSNKYELPINGNISITAKSGSKVYMGQDIAMLPGSVINLEKGAYGELLDGINIYLYDLEDWGKFIFRNNKDTTFSPITYSPGKTYTRTDADLFDATVRVDGTFDATKGHVYTTTHGANIYSTGTGVVKAVAGTETYTYQLNQEVASYKQIPIVPAILQNEENGSTLQTTTNTYTYINGRWVCETHSFDEGKVTTEPTCEAEGVKTYTCACGETKTEVIPATGHTPGAEATCTEDQTCTACGDVITEALGHSSVGEWIIEAVPTYSADGCKYHICEVCKEKGDETIIPKHTTPDINSDGVLGADDLVRLKKIVLGIDLVETDVDNDIYETIMDLNDDSKYNIMDLIKLKRIILAL